MKVLVLFLAALLPLSLIAPKAMADDGRAGNPIACPMIAKLCPDGSSVSPQGPKCQMPPCPNGGDAQVKAPEKDNCTGDDCEGKKTDEEND